MPPRQSMLELPAELVHHILTYLEANDLARLAKTCRALKVLSYDDRLWQALIEKELPDDQSTVPLSTSFRDIFITHHPYWFLVRGKIWFGDNAPNGKLLVARYDAQTGSIAAHTATAVRVGHTVQRWERNHEVIIHDFEPKVSLDLNRPALKLDLESTTLLPGWPSERGYAPENRYSQETLMPIFTDPGLYESLMLCRPLAISAISEQTQIWPPLRFPSHSYVRSESQDNFQSSGHKPSKWSEVSQDTFRIHKWVEYTGRRSTHLTSIASSLHMLGTLTDRFGFMGPLTLSAHISRGNSSRFPESITTYATLPPASYIPTKQKPWQGIWCGDYSGHGCEFLVITQPDQKDEKPLPENLSWLREWLRSGRRGSTSSTSSFSSAYEDLSAHGSAMTPETSSVEDSMVVDDASAGSAVPSGRLEAIKLTGDPNIPRGEYTFIAPDIGQGGFVREADEAVFRGARIVRSAGHIAGRGFREDQYTPSQLIMISHDRLAQFWEGFGHISYYQRVDLDALMKI